MLAIGITPVGPTFMAEEVAEVRSTSAALNAADGAADGMDSVLMMNGHSIYLLMIMGSRRAAVERAFTRLDRFYHHLKAHACIPIIERVAAHILCWLR